MPSRLVEGRKYSAAAREVIFDFVYKGRGGIRKAASGDIVLISNNKGKSGGYTDFCDDGVFNYEGQNTGGVEQELIFGNKDLDDIYKNDNDKNIYVFRDNEYVGEYFIVSKPYKEDGSWRFPLLKK